MTTRITEVRARRIWDSRGRPTVEVEVAISALPPSRDLFGVPSSAISTSSARRCSRASSPSSAGAISHATFATALSTP